jgi:hypothetical protein
MTSCAVPSPPCSSLAALPAAAETEVDVELVLAVDVSRSMSPFELEIQRRGYAEALVSDEVLSAIADGFTGRIAVSYIEWAGSGSTRVVLDWTLIEGREDAERVADGALAHRPTGCGARRSRARCARRPVSSRTTASPPSAR